MYAQLREIGPLIILLPLLFGVGECQESPQCSDIPMSWIGGFEGVLYDENVGGQALSTPSHYCMNIYGDITNMTNPEQVQTVVVEERVQGQDLLYIFVGSFENPVYWDGGAQIIVRATAAETAAATGNAIPIDGQSAQAFVWDEGYWDTDSQPQYRSISGELYFDKAILVAGGSIESDYSGMLENYVPEASRDSWLKPIPQITP